LGDLVRLPFEGLDIEQYQQKRGQNGQRRFYFANLSFPILSGSWNFMILIIFDSRTKDIQGLTIYKSEMRERIVQS